MQEPLLSTRRDEVTELQVILFSITSKALRFTALIEVRKRLAGKFKIPNEIQFRCSPSAVADGEGAQGRVERY
jgi:hypothetical protein